MIFEFGRCPECESYNVIYGDITWNEDYVYPRIQQEAHCCDCGCEFREFYNTTPDGTETDEHGKKYEDDGNQDADDKGENQDDNEIRADIMRLLGLEAK